MSSPSSDSCNDNTDEVKDEDTIRILLATDIHLGYEQSTKRKQDNDSFVTFEEILQHAKSEDVDFILLGGDLFHDCKPTIPMMTRCIELLRKYTLGSRKMKINFLTNPDIVFENTAQHMVNYEHPSVDISVPIFSIHGNHDNPSFQTTGPMDMLSSTGFINYFGKWSDLTKVKIPPLVMNKGETYISIYGLSYMNDQRLSRILRDNLLTLVRPVGIPDPFKIMMLHQNRSHHAANDFIPENKLPRCVDLIFWGHEHECRVQAEHIEDRTVSPHLSYYITQPGSSVATSLCQGEAKQKKVGLLEINKQKFKISGIPLKTVRPFVFEDLYLHDIDFEMDSKRLDSAFVRDYVNDYIENIMLPKADKLITDNPNQPKIPLLRLRIFYRQESELFDICELSRKYTDRVANARDMIVFLREKKGAAEDDKTEVFIVDDDDIAECFRDNGGGNWSRTIQDGIRHYFSREDAKDELTVLSVDGLTQALSNFVEAGDDDAFKNLVAYQEKKAVEYLKKYDFEDESQMKEQLKVYGEERKRNRNETDEIKKFLKDEAARRSGKIFAGNKKQSRTIATRDDSEKSESEEEDIILVSKQPAPRGRARASRARAPRGSAMTTSERTRGRGRGAAAKTTFDTTEASSSRSVAKATTTRPEKPSGSHHQMSNLRPNLYQKQKISFIECSDSD